METYVIENESEYILGYMYKMLLTT